MRKASQILCKYDTGSYIGGGHGTLWDGSMLAWRSSIGWVDESPIGAPVVNEPVGDAEGWTKDILILFSSPPPKAGTSA
jgi:hypothetical protein